MRTARFAHSRATCGWFDAFRTLASAAASQSTQLRYSTASSIRSLPWAGVLPRSRATRGASSARSSAFGRTPLHASIPPSPEELADVDMPDELDVLTEIRMVAVIVLDDRIDPLIETLNAAAEYRQPARA